MGFDFNQLTFVID